MDPPPEDGAFRDVDDSWFGATWGQALRVEARRYGRILAGRPTCLGNVSQSLATSAPVPIITMSHVKERVCAPQRLLRPMLSLFATGGDQQSRTARADKSLKLAVAMLGAPQLTACRARRRRPERARSIAVLRTSARTMGTRVRGLGFAGSSPGR
jgi:hypothetical protein